jgi:hypothetical protein
MKEMDRLSSGSYGHVFQNVEPEEATENLGCKKRSELTALFDYVSIRFLNENCINFQ